MKTNDCKKRLNIATIIVQYNQWEDTINCVESILSSDEQPRWVIIVDNNSENNAAQKILNWTQGRVNVPKCPVVDYTAPEFPLQIQEIHWPKECFHATPQTQLVLVHMPHNAGYAAANNAGMKLGLDWGVEAFLILNNDITYSKIGQKKLSYNSANEINYLAFNLATEEYHNELYEELKNRYGANLGIKDFDTQFFINNQGETK